jgi:hypothetical protein
MKIPRRGWSHVLALFFLLLSVSVCSDEPVVPGATVLISGAHGLMVGDSLTLSAVTSGAADSAYGWASSRTDVATVDQAGTVTGVAPGEALISATGSESGASASHVVVVTPIPDGAVVVTVTGNPFIQTGASVTLTATTAGGDDASYGWSSSDETVAVADAGVVTGVHPGQATITATGSDTGVSGTLIVVVQNEIPNYDAWLSSAHANKSSAAFNHWNDADPAEIPTSCARCHSTPGYVDYLGGDGSPAGQVDAPAPVGTVVDCGACHNDAAESLEAVTFPSGVTVDRLGAEARCMVCHQGRSSKDSVDLLIETAGVTSPDEPSTMLGFQNIHYYAAAATLNAGRVRGGYQYAGEVYDWRFRHAPGYDTCIGCHDPHSLEVKVDECSDCHANVATKDDLKNVRMIASLGQDYDGDGNTTEGMFYEIEGLRTLLMTAIQAYASEELGKAICQADDYPYWFIDTDESGSCSTDETTNANKFAPFTARLVRATYNWQVTGNDPGGFAHNSKYLIQLLHDSIADINKSLTTPIDMSNAVRNDFGHFNGASKAARNWDANESINASCTKCHSGSEGFRFFLKHGVGTSVVEPDNGMDCATCHDSFGPNWDVVTVNSVTYPGGITINDPGQIANICSTCHSGRESKKTIDDAIAANSLGFRNVHYLPAGGIKKGTLAKVGYEYTGKSYAGEWTTHGRCINCHDPVATNHTFSVHDNPACTNGCHAPTPIAMIRESHNLDYDGDGLTSEPLAGEIDTLASALLTAMNAASASPGPGLCYDANTYPYFFKDNDSSGGTCNGAEATSANGFKAWTPALMKAAHNYQISQKEHGAWAHNFDYMVQLLIDSIEDLGGNVSNYVRP